ncbi:glycosyltransferase family 1 protein [Mycena belliarum]|uniref:sterol 3beta-glucosyltransferase n=1 Tax=Mycena belliarum TaxID=1033014 RepID=A0AAD6U9F4_9AGAR|nr:glycosyltransferase family 1 protein [Mycena belliae]
MPDSASRADTLSSIDPSNSDDSEDFTPVASLDHFYSEAGRFQEALAHTGCIEAYATHRRSESLDLQAFKELITKDLNPREQALVYRDAKLFSRATGSTPSWTPSPASSISEEPESYSEEPGDILEGSDESTVCEIPPPVLHRSGTLDSDPWKLDPIEVIRLLVSEFGSLNASSEEEESLLLETDGAIIKDVAIVGVIHLTTQRLTFHASLFTEPEVNAIKAGPVTIHRRKGWRTFKRRLWMELYHDMLCTYASSSDDDRIRPLRTVLLSAIQKIAPIDPKHPGYIRIVFESPDMTDSLSGIAAFDTEEAALDWRKEITGAVFLYRHRRREALDGSDDERDGIRLCVPLARLASVTFPDPEMPHLASLALNSDDNAPRLIRLGTIYAQPTWHQLPEILARYQRTRSMSPSELDEMPIFVDLGPLSFKDPLSDVETSNIKEAAVRKALALGGEPTLWMAKARVHRTVASGGYFVISTNYICFWSKFFTQGDLRYRLPISTVRKAKPFSLLTKCAFGLALELEGHPDLKFLFKTDSTRTEVITRITTALSESHTRQATPGVNTPTTMVSPLKRSATGVFAPLQRSVAAMASGPSQAAHMPKAVNLPREILVRRSAKHFVCLTIGSRGDVQPYIALGLGLMKEGHSVTIVTHEEYKPWIESFGIKHKQAGGDPGALMKLSVENKMFSPEFFKESIQNFRPWLDQLLIDSWESCQGADILLESPSAMSGVHIAEALNIPYFRTFTMPWTKTSEFPHAFLSPPVEAPTFNCASYVLFSNVIWAATSGQINRWRRNTLKIGNTDMGHLAQSKIPFIYNFSQAVVPKPLDWGDATTVSGYWFLDNPEGANWTPPPDLLEWMGKARKDGKPIVYIGFGSITIPHPNKMTARIVKAVLKSDVRAIISKGWSARMSKGNDKDPEVEMPPECYSLDKVPHDWLFPLIDACLHHGGAGTTGASLRAGIPTLIKPFFGDQFFWSSRVQKLGAGLKVTSMHASDLSEALIKATTSRIMKEKAAAVGERIRAEDGVHTAIHTIYTYLEHASSYIEMIRSH